MRRELGFGLVLTMLAFFLTSGIASAQATRTWVSGVGDDANPCSRTAPCKTFAGAISKTAAAGEISVLDPGGFGTLTITKSLSIVAVGAEGSILAAGTNGIVINAGVADNVSLRGIKFEGAGTGVNGIVVNGGASIHVEDCAIRGFTGAGIVVQSASSHVNVARSSIYQNATGLNISSGGITMENSSLERNSTQNILMTGGSLNLSSNIITAGTAFTISGSTSIASFGNNSITGPVPAGTIKEALQ